MVGNGQLGDQTNNAASVLPASSGGDGGAWNSGNLAQTQTNSASNAKQTGKSGGSISSDTQSSAGRVEVALGAIVLGLVAVFF
jgi:hypothetical protein